MKLKVVMIFTVCVCLVSFISASTKLEIQTLPNHELFITEIDAYSGSSNTPVAPPFNTFTGNEGKLVLDYTPHKSIFKLGFLLKDDAGIKSIGYTIFDEEDELLHDGKLIKITLLRDEKSIEELEITEESQEVEVANISQTNESELIENETLVTGVLVEDNSTGIIDGIFIHGNSIYQENKSVVNVISYAVGIFILIVPLFFFFRKRLSGKSVLTSKDPCEDDFEKAERDLVKAKARMDELKGKRLNATRQKLVDDERELMRLRSLGKD
jgi:hypothetical protein